MADQFPRPPADDAEREACENRRLGCHFCLASKSANRAPFCSRKPHSDGNHVAATLNGLVLAVWPQAPADEPAAPTPAEVAALVEKALWGVTGGERSTVREAVRVLIVEHLAALASQARDLDHAQTLLDAINRQLGIDDETPELDAIAALQEKARELEAAREDHDAEERAAGWHDRANGLALAHAETEAGRVLAMLERDAAREEAGRLRARLTEVEGERDAATARAVAAEEALARVSERLAMATGFALDFYTRIIRIGSVADRGWAVERTHPTKGYLEWLAVEGKWEIRPGTGDSWRRFKFPDVDAALAALAVSRG